MTRTKRRIWMYLRLTNATTPRSRLQYQVHTPEGAVYWVLTRGR
jgi:hypothetical protein